MSSHTLTSLLLSSANVSDASNSTEIAITNATTTILPSTTTLASTQATNKLLVTKLAVTSTPSPLLTTVIPEDDSHFLFGFCTVLFFVAIALIMKIVYSNRKKYRNLTSIPSWRLSASRSSGNMPPGFSLTRDPFAPRTARGEAFNSAHYTVVPPSTNARLSQQQDAFVGNSNTHEWERGFFEDEHVNDNDSSRLELRH